MGREWRPRRTSKAGIEGKGLGLVAIPWNRFRRAIVGLGVIWTPKPTIIRVEPLATGPGTLPSMPAVDVRGAPAITSAEYRDRPETGAFQTSQVMVETPSRGKDGARSAGQGAADRTRNTRTRGGPPDASSCQRASSGGVPRSPCPVPRRVRRAGRARARRRGGARAAAPHRSAAAPAAAATSARAAAAAPVSAATSARAAACTRAGSAVGPSPPPRCAPRCSA